MRSTPGVAIIGTDPACRVTLFNPGAESLLGYRAEEVIGSSIERLFSPASVRLKAAELGVPDDFVSVARAIVDPAVGQTSLRFLRSDGEERDHVLTLSRITADDGTTLGFVSTSEDVTERLEAENALKEAVEQLRQVDAVKDAFVSSVSHELRTPITSIQGYLELLEDGSYGDLRARPAQRGTPGGGQQPAAAGPHRRPADAVEDAGGVLDRGRRAGLRPAACRRGGLRPGHAGPGEPDG